MNTGVVEMPEAGQGWRRVLQSPLLRPLNDVAVWRGLLGRINPMWGLGEVRARVVGLEHHGPRLLSILLQPNRAWQGFRAGQHVLLERELEGRLRQRTFSISSAPQADPRAPFRITVQRQAAGGLSDDLHRTLRIGSVLRLSQAQGSFGQDCGDLDEPLLLIAAGSGITPLHSILSDRIRRGQRGPVLLAVLARTPEERPFAAEVEALQALAPQLRTRFWYSQELGRLDLEHTLTDWLPEAGHMRTLLCGPSPVMRAVAAVYRRMNALSLLRFEDFGGAARLLDPVDPAAPGHAVYRPSHAGPSFRAAPGATLLRAAEDAGLQPASGCRIGICMSCLCRKRSGVVENLRTGARSGPDDEWIQLCVSVARSDVELEL